MEGGVQSLQREFKGGTTENSLPMGGGGRIVAIQQNFMGNLGYIHA